ncbi:MAG: FAD-dependent oxidoreductase [Dehalococcoidales bacterium]|nr:FAD-dependent oxidoreductase [Dehalococcoidales bacterium]
MAIAAKTYYSPDSKRKVPAYIHFEKCWPAVDKYSPCEVSCPLHMDVPNYIIAVAEGNANKALAIIRETNPLPSICGRVCHHPCETDCNRKIVDSPVAIQWLKQFAADWGQEEKPSPVPMVKEAKVAIVGSGPAGLTAAHDLVKRGYGVSIFEADAVPGGILASAIPDFILSKGAVEKDINYLKALGIKIHTGIRIGKDVSLDTLQKQGFKAVLIATGAQNSVMLRIPGAELKGITPALTYLKEAKQGILKPFNGRVWVIGGGAVAMDVARTAIRNGAKEVHVACLESRENMPAFDWEIEAAERENIRIHPSLAPHEFIAKNGSKVSGIKFKRVASTSLDNEGRIHWTLSEGTGSDFEIETDAIIVAIGQAIDKENLPAGSLDISQRGTVVVNKATGETNTAGIFAAGDISGTGRTVTDSMAAGRRAAISIDQYLSGQPISPSKSNMDVITIKPEQVPGYFVRRDRWEMPKLQSRQAVKTNREVNLGYAFWQAVEEANRCLNCRMCANCVFERGQLCFETASRLL